MGAKAFFVFSYPQALEVTTLGRLIQFPKAPGSDYFDPTEKLATHPRPEMVTSEVNNIAKILKMSSGGKIELVFTTFASTFLKGNTKDVKQLTAKLGRQQLLLNSGDWFEKICQDERTQRWLEKKKKRKVFLVTGIETLTDIDVHLDKDYTTAVGAGFQAPILSAAGVPIPTPLDLAAHVERSHGHGKMESFEVPGEKIYRIQVQEIKLRKKSDIDPVEGDLTSKVYWEEIWGAPGADEDTNEESELRDEDMVEALLLDGWVVDENEKEAYEYVRDEETGEICIFETND